MSIKEAYQNLTAELSALYGSGEAASIARIVFEDAFGIRNLKRRGELPPEQEEQLRSISSRLMQYEPVQYILGKADFYGLEFKVGPEVLIPRQETEELVHWMLETLGREPLRILDIGAGSGCISVSLKKHRPAWPVWAVDISQEALELAAENARMNGVEVSFKQMDILDEGSWAELGLFDAIVSNPPYIPLWETVLVPEQVKRYEPPQALFVDGQEPLLFYKAISRFAGRFLRPGGSLFFECNEFNAGKVVELLHNQGFIEIELRRDMNGKERMIRAVVGSQSPGG